ncbi:hypothetical protein CYMTET_17553 [Cymbomonas tetramitiformis]|uniref:Uncharacterized protein n=1 Tax=Cymbomonas tetramitiformis TaxID=36881 RepID=A0AAE0GAB9_9CHLO|nr:hypothetical protein CYMTET_17553 [Cymbomonas tetramitiformis]
MYGGDGTPSRNRAEQHALRTCGAHYSSSQPRLQHHQMPTVYLMYAANHTGMPILIMARYVVMSVWPVLALECLYNGVQMAMEISQNNQRTSVRNASRRMTMFTRLHHLKERENSISENKSDFLKSEHED